MDYIIILLTFVFASLLVVLVISITNYITPHKGNKQKMLPYECGEQTIGPSWIKFNPGFYIFGLIFLLFDIESIFLIPWAIVLRESGFTGFLEVLVFIFILVLGLAYAWVKGALEWKV
jgi:NADH-quinone oxidoreductase subunit A